MLLIPKWISFEGPLDYTQTNINEQVWVPSAPVHFFLPSCQVVMGEPMLALSSSLARLLQLWYFLPFVAAFVAAIQANQLLLSVGTVILLIAVVVQRFRLRRHIFADVFLVIVLA